MDNFNKIEIDFGIEIFAILNISHSLQSLPATSPSNPTSISIISNDSLNSNADDFIVHSIPYENCKNNNKTTNSNMNEKNEVDQKEVVS